MTRPKKGAAKKPPKRKPAKAKAKPAADTQVPRFWVCYRAEDLGDGQETEADDGLRARPFDSLDAAAPLLASILEAGAEHVIVYGCRVAVKLEKTVVLADEPKVEQPTVPPDEDDDDGDEDREDPEEDDGVGKEDEPEEDER